MNTEDNKVLEYQCIVGYLVQDKIIEQTLSEVNYIKQASSGGAVTTPITKYLKNYQDISSVLSIFGDSEHFIMSDSRRKELLFIKFYVNS